MRLRKDLVEMFPKATIFGVRVAPWVWRNFARHFVQGDGVGNLAYYWYTLSYSSSSHSH